MLTQEQYEKWCEATDKTNEELVKLHRDRRENNDWICDEVLAFFSEFDGVDVLSTESAFDGSKIIVHFKGKLDIKDKRLDEFPIPMLVQMDKGEMVIVLNPEITGVNKY